MGAGLVFAPKGRATSPRATAPATKPGDLIARCRSRRYGRASNGQAATARDKTTKPPRPAASRCCAPRTADGRTLTAQSDQGYRHVPIGSFYLNDLQVGMARPANTPGRTTQPPRPNSLIALPPQGDVVWRLDAKTNAAAKTAMNASQPINPTHPIQKSIRRTGTPKRLMNMLRLRQLRHQAIQHIPIDRG